MDQRDELRQAFHTLVKDSKSAKRILLVGQQGVGKSSLLNSFVCAITGRYDERSEIGQGDDHNTVDLQL